MGEKTNRGTRSHMGDSSYADNLRVIYETLPEGPLRKFISSGLNKLPGKWRVASSQHSCIFCRKPNDGMVVVSYPNFPMVFGYTRHEFKMCKECETVVSEAEELLDTTIRINQPELFEPDSPLEFFIQTGGFMEDVVTYNVCLPDLPLSGRCCFCSSPVFIFTDSTIIDTPVNYEEKITQARVEICVSCMTHIKNRTGKTRMADIMGEYYLEEYCSDCGSMYWITRDEELYRSIGNYKNYTCATCTARNVWRSEQHPLFYRDIPNAYFVRFFEHRCQCCDTEILIDSLKKKSYNVSKHFFDSGIYCLDCSYQRQPCIFYKKIGDKIHRIFPTSKNVCYHTISTENRILSRIKIANRILADEVTRLDQISYNPELFYGET